MVLVCVIKVPGQCTEKEWPSYSKRIFFKRLDSCICSGVYPFNMTEPTQCLMDAKLYIQVIYKFST